MSTENKSPVSTSPLMALPELTGYTTVCRSGLYDLIARDEFPQPVKLGKSSRWVRAEVDAWLAAQMINRGVGKGFGRGAKNVQVAA